MSGNNALEQLSGIMEFSELNDFMEDEDVESALLKLTSVLAKQDINPVHVARHIVHCDALATSFALKAKYYMTIGKGEPNASAKKGVYMTLREEFHELSNSLKYLVRNT